MGDFSFFLGDMSFLQLEQIKSKILEIITFFKQIYTGDKTSIKEEFTKEILEVLFNDQINIKKKFNLDLFGLIG